MGNGNMTNNRSIIMEIHVTKTPELTIVAINGKLDANTIADFQKSSADLPVMPTVLDLSRLEYLSSSALRALLQLKREFSKQGVPVVIAGSDGLVDKVLRVSGFEQIFVLFPSVDEAVRVMTRGGG
jgi:anti-sigma B factor antagonist